MYCRSVSWHKLSGKQFGNQYWDPKNVHILWLSKSPRSFPYRINQRFWQRFIYKDILYIIIYYISKLEATYISNNSKINKLWYIPKSIMQLSKMTFPWDGTVLYPSCRGGYMKRHMSWFSQIRTPNTSPFRCMQSEYKYNAKKAVPFISGQTLISAGGVNNSAAALFCLVELLLKCHWRTRFL